jgi:hypothetical protein
LVAITVRRWSDEDPTRLFASLTTPRGPRMSDPMFPERADTGYRGRGGVPQAPQAASLADVLELVLDKGVVIAGDIKINLLEIELLTIKLRLLIASVDKAREMGINWWESDPTLSSSAEQLDGQSSPEELNQRIEKLERRLAEVTGDQSELPQGEGQARR